MTRTEAGTKFWRENLQRLHLNRNFETLKSDILLFFLIIIIIRSSMIFRQAYSRSTRRRCIHGTGNASGGLSRCAFSYSLGSKLQYKKTVKAKRSRWLDANRHFRSRPRRAHHFAVASAVATVIVKNAVQWQCQTQLRYKLLCEAVKLWQCPLHSL